MSSIVNKFLYPRPNPPHYSITSHPEHLIFIPCNETLPSIPCLYFQSSKLRTTPFIIWSHGNGCDIGSMAELLSYLSTKLHINILIYEYPSYGLCSSQSVSKQVIDQHTKQAYNFVRNIIQCPSERIVFYGHSIGSGTSCQMVSSLIKNGITVGGIILQSPFKSLNKLIGEKTFQLSGLINIEGWDNFETMKFISCPILFLHGQRDDLIPIQNTIDLHAACISKNKHKVELDYADHNSIHREDILDNVRLFLDTYLFLNNSMNMKEEIQFDEKYRIVPNEFKQQSDNIGHFTSSLTDGTRSSSNMISSIFPTSSKRYSQRTGTRLNGVTINGFYIEDDIDDTDKITDFYYDQIKDSIVCRSDCYKVFQCHLADLHGSLTIRVDKANWRPNNNNEVFKIHQQSKTIPNFVKFLKQVRKDFGPYQCGSNDSQDFIEKVGHYLQE